MSDFTPQPGPPPVYSWPPQPVPQQMPPMQMPMPQPPQWIETEPLEHHRLYRGARRYRWWKPLLALALGVVYYLTLSFVFALVVLVPLLLATGSSLDERSIMALALPDTRNPLSLVVALGSLVLMIPSVWLAMLSTGLGPFGRAWSVAGRIRWRWIGRTILPAVCALVVMTAVGIALEIAFAGGAVESFPRTSPYIDWNVALVSGLLLLLLVPLQAAAEELVFRGMFMQVLGAWIRSPWPIIAITAIVFALGHIYDIWGLLSIGVMGLTAAWITWRTGGLEAAVSLHVINNWVAFGMMIVGFGGETGQTESGGGAANLLASIIGLVGYVWWVDRDFRRRDGMRTRIDIVERRIAAAPPVYSMSGMR